MVNEAEPVTTVRWKSSLGCMLPVTAVVILFCVRIAVDENYAAGFADSWRGRWIADTAGMTLGGVNVPFALLVIWCCLIFAHSGWRWADEIAARATAAGIVPHPSTWRGICRWEEIADVAVRLDRRRLASLVIELKDGRARFIGPVENDDGSAERFAAYARRRAREHGGG
jgi:hypothetical protein